MGYILTGTLVLLSRYELKVRHDKLCDKPALAARGTEPMVDRQMQMGYIDAGN